MSFKLGLGLNKTRKSIRQIFLPFSWGFVEETWDFLDTETWDDMGA